MVATPSTSSQTKGVVRQVIGPVLDVEFPAGKLPKILNALRIEQIGENEGKSMAAGAAMAVVGWWTGYKLGGVLSLFAADILQNIGFENY